MKKPKPPAGVPGPAAPFAVPSWPATTPKLIPLREIIPYPQNPRTHPRAQITLLAELMKRHGVDQPIVVDEAGVILKGHGRLAAAHEAGFESFPVVRHLGLSDDDKRALRIADNQVALLAGWDSSLIKGELAELKVAGFNMPLLGFAESQLIGWGVASGSAGLQDAEIAPALPRHPFVHAGDLWTFGDHRLLCGDSTSASDVSKCLGGAKPNLMVTDPPYGVEYDPNWRNEAGRSLDGGFQRLKSGRAGKPIGARAIGKVQNDDRDEWSAAWRLFGGDIVYVWHGSTRVSATQQALSEEGFQFVAQIIWAKSRFVIGRGDYHWQHETCWYAVRRGKNHQWNGGRSQTTLWPITHTASETGHGTQKPIECMKRPIENNSKPGDYVYEPFSGSGTTIIAAEMTARKALAIEIDPGYCQVAIERWQTFTGKQATLDGKTFAEVQRERQKKRAARAAPVAASASPAT